VVRLTEERVITPYVWVHPEGDRRDGPRIGNLAHSFCTVGSMPKYYFESSAQRHRGGVLALLLWRRIAVRLLRVAMSIIALASWLGP
jgi:hypothetical protein